MQIAFRSSFELLVIKFSAASLLGIRKGDRREEVAQRKVVLNFLFFFILITEYSN